MKKSAYGMEYMMIDSPPTPLVGVELVRDEDIGDANLPLFESDAEGH
jgi:hypothetical protein